jgi:hypothetical protein
MTVSEILQAVELCFSRTRATIDQIVAESKTIEVQEADDPKAFETPDEV